MAAALLANRSQGAIKARSAGSEPADRINPAGFGRWTDRVTPSPWSAIWALGAMREPQPKPGAALPVSPLK